MAISYKFFFMTSSDYCREYGHISFNEDLIYLILEENNSSELLPYVTSKVNDIYDWYFEFKLKTDEISKWPVFFYLRIKQ